jgi:transposase
MSETFEALYAPIGRPSIPPEMFLRALLLQAVHGIRFERMLMVRLDFDLLFRWFVGLGVDDPVCDASSSRSGDRLLAGEAAGAFLAAIVAHPRVRRLTSSNHFSVDGTLIEVWASMKSVKPKDAGDGPADPPDNAPPPDGESRGRNAEVDFRGQRRTNETHASTTDPDARLYRKSPGVGAALCFMGLALMENRNGLFVDAELTRVTGTAERVAARAMHEGVAREEGSHVTLAADRA